MNIDEALVRGSPVTALFVDRDGKVIKCQNGSLLADMGIHWISDIEGRNLHDVLEPHFTGGMTKERHKDYFDGHMDDPKPRQLRNGRPFMLKGRGGREFQVLITLSEPRRVAFSSIPGLPATDHVEGVVAWVLPWENLNE